MSNRFTISFGLCVFFFGMTDCSKENNAEILPMILSVSPNTGSYDMRVSIVGTNFGSSIGDNIVKFNGVETPILSLNAQLINSPNSIELIVLAPKNAKTGTVTIETKSKIAIGPVFNYITPASTDYYIKFKADGILKELHTNDPGYGTNFNYTCAFTNINASSGGSMLLQVCWSTANITPELILSLKGKTLPMRTNAGYPYAGFSFLPNSNSYTFNSGILNNLNTTMTINDVVYHSSYQGANAYNVSGTFTGIIQDRDVSVISVTEGEFLIRFTSSKGG